jgi:hypothetical protein
VPDFTYRPTGFPPFTGGAVANAGGPERPLVSPQAYTTTGPGDEGEGMAGHVAGMLEDQALRPLLIAHRRSDISIVQSIPPWTPDGPVKGGMMNWTAIWQGGRDHQFNYRADLYGGPRAGQVHTLDEPLTYLAFAEADPFSLDPYYYRPLGIDPSDGHWVYGYWQGRPWDDYLG